MSIEEFDYETDISIDDSALDVEWLQQPILMMKYAQLEAQAQQEYEDAQVAYNITKAEIDRDIRDNPENYDLPKTTEGAIQAALRTTDRYKKAKKELNEAQYNWNMAQAAVRAMYGKKDALENLVRLHGQQYFAGPQVPRDLSKEWEQKQKQVSSNKKVKIKKKSKRRRRKK